ncbi:MAG TPA: NAD(P)H-dependent oxidoreductase [Pseudomonadales bacterium]|nr:NAD(P)H-dependent oxidoreductase [Pseudomonadales bacterium]
MPTLLHLRTSLFGDQGQSSRLADRFVEQWTQQQPDTRVRLRDLAAAPVPHLDADGFTAFLDGDGDLTSAQRDTLALSSTLVQELVEADVVVLALPMYNFNVPSTLKAWFDHVARAGISFRYTATGPVGLLADRPVYVLAARGGLYAGTERDVQTPYVRQILGLLGIHDLHWTYAEGLAVSEEVRDAALSSAHARIDALAGAEPGREAVRP